jgi:hypothetical protein
MSKYASFFELGSLLKVAERRQEKIVLGAMSAQTLLPY